MKTLVLLVLGSIAVLPCSAQTSFKSDIGIKVNSFDQERFQLEYRRHMNEKWSFTVGLIYGQHYDGNINSFYASSDSMFYSSYYSNESQHFGVSLGVNRRFSFMKHNFYYAGASISGTTMYRDYQSWSYKYKVDPSDGMWTFEEPQEEYTYNIRTRGNGVGTRLYVGADVPIIDRLSLNFEMGGLVNFEGTNSGSYTSYFFNINGFVSGGLRYNFGKID